MASASPSPTIELVENSTLPAPFSQAPTDILFTIFLACLADLKRSPKMSKKHPIIAVSQVSRRWRDLSLSMPALWSVVDVDIPPMAEWVLALERTTKAFLLRSRECPLTIRMQASDRDDLGSASAVRELDTLVEPVVGSLLAHSHRWKELQVNFTGPWMEPSAPFHFISTLKPDLVPKLERVVLDFCDGSSDHDEVTYSILQSPALRSLELKNFWSDFSTNSVNWKLLTVLSLGDEVVEDPLTMWLNGLTFVDVPFVVEVLGQCLNLVHCSFTLTQMSSSPENTPITIQGRISLPRL